MLDLNIMHYDPSKEIIVSSDACNLGLGIVILHKEKRSQLKAVHDVSRTLVSAGIDYSRIEKEGLGLICTVKKFYKYMHGWEFLLQTDHRQLLSIFGSKKGTPAH